MSKPTSLNFPPGVQRDGTRVDSDTCIDALWTRFRLARPRKMKGYQEITHLLSGVGRRVHEFYQGSQTIIHVGTSNSLQQIVIDRNGNFISMADRTPAVFEGGLNVGWTLDALFDTTSTAVTLVAHSQPNINLAAGTAKTPIFSGLIDATTPLVTLPNPSSTFGGTYKAPSVAGGIVCVQPYLFDYDSDGFIGWSAPNLPDTLGVVGGVGGAGQARESAQKIIAGLPLRGGGSNSPAALFWSLSEVISANFVGQANGIFSFNTVSSNSSILSNASVIEHDGLYFWAGVDRFLLYNGTVVEVPNSFNLDWFFDNINRDEAGKSFAFKVPHFGEIWFCAPLFGATEPSHAAIYNVREKCWYDTALPNGGRTAGYFAQGFPFPVMTSPEPTPIIDNPPGYSLWLHEKGRDEVVPEIAPQPIRSYFETPLVGGPKANPPSDKGVSFQQLEADIQQSGDMVVWVAGSFNARGGDFASDPAFLKANPTTPAEQLIGFKTSRRLGRLHFESYTLNGDFITGRSVLHVDESDEHKIGGTGVPLTNANLVSGASSPPFTETDVPLENFIKTP
jgi:hypothetical protein